MTPGPDTGLPPPELLPNGEPYRSLPRLDQHVTIFSSNSARTRLDLIAENTHVQARDTTDY